jgi:outer membrane immunogenic protein
MTTKLIRAGFAVAALLIAPIAAQAADLPQPGYKAPAYSAPVYANWSGFYAGLNVGYGFGKSNWTSATGTTGDFNVTGMLAGLTLGYNMQTGTWVWGLEGDIDYSGIKGSTTTNCPLSCETKNSWLSTARVRLGYAGWNNWLPYLTGGLAMGDIKGTDALGSFTKTKMGYALGVGVEYAFMGNWSTKLEYLYADLGKATCPAATCIVDTDVKFNTNIVRLGVNYRF